MHRGTADLRYHYKPWGLRARLRGQVVGPRPFYLDDDGDTVQERVDAVPYGTLDARVSVDVFDQHLSVFVGGDNLINQGDSRFLPIPPLTIYGGLVGRFPGVKK